MKTTNKIILAVAILAVSSALANQARADDSLLPPRARALRPNVVARDTQNEPDLVRDQLTGPAAKIAAQKTTVRAKVSQSQPNRKGGPLYTGGNPFRETRPPQFEVAPIK